VGGSATGVDDLMLNGMEVTRGPAGGELTIRTRVDNDAVLVSVCDDGEGIPADKIGHIFNAFLHHESRWTGMGLPISRAIIESHGGRLWATVNPERGATFHFTLPTAR
jgi:signal transduction histidine kinase